MGQQNPYMAQDGEAGKPKKQEQAPPPQQNIVNNMPRRQSQILGRTFAFGIIMIFLQIGISVTYGILFTIEPRALNVSAIIIMTLLAILVIAGFGLVFGYTKKLVWSGIGFNLLITALAIQLFPLVNDLWTRVQFQGKNNPLINFDYDKRYYILQLSDRQSAANNQTTFYGNSLVNALKCALSICVGFSAILGRASQLEALIVTFFGVIGFQLNRQIIQNNDGIDTFGTYYIFAFGGFLGLGLGITSFVRERNVKHAIGIRSLQAYTSSPQAATNSLFGCLIIFALFPVLAYEFDGYSTYNSYSPYTNPLCIIGGLGAGAMAAIGTSVLLNGEIIVRDLVHGPIAGAIVVGASSLYITYPLYSLLAGFAGGLVQTLIQNLLEKRFITGKSVLSTVSWSLFGIQGIIGAGVSTGWKTILYANYNGLTVQSAVVSNLKPQFQFYGGLISAGIGLVFGFFIGLIVSLVNGHENDQYFNDFNYWYSGDCIIYNVPMKQQEEIKVQKQEQKPQSVVQISAHLSKELIHQPQNQKVIKTQVQMDFSEDDYLDQYKDVGNPYSYL